MYLVFFFKLNFDFSDSNYEDVTLLLSTSSIIQKYRYFSEKLETRYLVLFYAPEIPHFLCGIAPNRG